MRQDTDKIRIVFVCSGNICRSPMAEAVFRQLVDEAGLADRFEISSAGIGDWHAGEPPHRGTREALRRHGIPLVDGKRAQIVTPAMLSGADYIIAMDQGHIHALRAYGDHLDGKVSRLLEHDPDAALLDVPDPYYSGKYEEVYQLVWPGSQALLKHIREREGV